MGSATATRRGGSPPGGPVFYLLRRSRERGPISPRLIEIDAPLRALSRTRDLLAVVAPAGFLVADRGDLGDLRDFLPPHARNGSAKYL